MENKIKISLIIPCYNEEANIQKGVLDKIGNFTKNDERFVEVIISDDGSTDKTKKIIKEKYLSLFPKFGLLENPHQGKGYAIIAAAKQAKGDYIMFSDIDLATPLEEAEKLIKETNKYDIVIGSRKEQRQGAPLTRKIMAKGFIIIRNLLINLPNIKDTQCGFKLFRKETALKIINNLKVFHKKRKVKGSSVSAAFDLEFLFLAVKFGYSIKEVPVIWRHVETKNVNFIKDSIETLKDLLKMKIYSLTNRYHL
jgi:glycosyltransferase involved in cell wall biosynthesis